MSERRCEHFLQTIGAEIVRYKQRWKCSLEYFLLKIKNATIRFVGMQDRINYYEEANPAPLHIATFHTRTVLSHDPDAICLPSGEKDKV
jgi:hypothetical protein